MKKGINNEPPTINPIPNNELAGLYPKELIGWTKGVNPGVSSAVNKSNIIINNEPKRPRTTPILIFFISNEMINHFSNLINKLIFEINKQF